MCSHYQGLKEAEKYRKLFGVGPPAEPSKWDLWPGYVGSFVRRHPQSDVGDEAVPNAEALSGLFGLVPHWALTHWGGARRMLLEPTHHSALSSWLVGPSSIPL